MRITVERLRVGLVAGACLLVLVIAGFFGYARYRLHRTLVSLPGRMGATITKEFNGWTYSQSNGKQTVYTIHASKAEQHTDGTLTLHDVSMILYGKTGDRADRISGDEFEYDTKGEVIRAAGIVHLDLEAPVAEGARTSEAAKHFDPGAGGRSEDHENGDASSRVVHIKTSGLVYMQKLGIAATKESIEFAFGGFTGHAVGAEYNSDTGHVVLQTALTVSGLDKGKPIAMSASHGELDRAANVAEFNDARYSSAGEVARADMARLHMRADGTIARIEGERHVLMEEAGDGRVTSDRVDATLDAKSKPETAILTGNVDFADDEALRQTRGDSERANVRFDAQGHIDHAVLVGSVRTSEVVRQVGSPTSQPQVSRRDLEADSLELWLMDEGATSKPVLRDAKATGEARMISVAPDAKGGGTTTTRLAGDTLAAHMVARSGVAELSTVHGAGHTLVQQTNEKNGEQKSVGETLDAVFRPTGKGKGDVELASAVQQGTVVIERSIPGKPSIAGTPSSGPEMQHATAAKAAFDADTSKLTLTADAGTGEVRMRDAESDIAATRVVIDQGTGDATAEGGVKVSYLQASPGPGSETAEPVHVVAARAELNHDAGRATFYGRAMGGSGLSGAEVGNRPVLARMWRVGTTGQGGSQIEAPVLVFEQQEKRLTARAERPGVMGTVHAVLVSAPSAKSAEEASRAQVESAKADGASVKNIGAADRGQGNASIRAKSVPKMMQPGLVRITSSLLVYSDSSRQAEFTGGIRVLDQNGEMVGQQATVFFSPASVDKAARPDGADVPATSAAAKQRRSARPGPNLTGLLGGNVERIVATQHIEITQPGRKATGERLVYTASDQMFVLTGTAAAPPRVTDAAQGATTGAELIFHSGDESVIVSGNHGEASAQRVRTETTIKPESKGQIGSTGKTGSRGQETKDRAAKDRAEKAQGAGVKQN